METRRILTIEPQNGELQDLHESIIRRAIALAHVESAYGPMTEESAEEVTNALFDVRDSITKELVDLVRRLETLAPDTDAERCPNMVVAFAIANGKQPESAATKIEERP